MLWKYQIAQSTEKNVCDDIQGAVSFLSLSRRRGVHGSREGHARSQVRRPQVGHRGAFRGRPDRLPGRRRGKLRRGHRQDPSAAARHAAADQAQRASVCGSLLRSGVWSMLPRCYGASDGNTWTMRGGLVGCVRVCVWIVTVDSYFEHLFFDALRAAFTLYDWWQNGIMLMHLLLTCSYRADQIINTCRHQALAHINLF